MKRSIKSQAVTNLNAAARNVDLRNVSLIAMEPITLKPGALRRVAGVLARVSNGASSRVSSFIVRTGEAAFSGPGVALFLAGVVFGLGVIAHH
jgi:hypothetical protein